MAKHDTRFLKSLCPKIKNPISLAYWAQNNGISRERARQFAFLGRLQGAVEVKPHLWVVPEDAPYPKVFKSWGMRSQIRKKKFSSKSLHRCV